MLDRVENWTEYLTERSKKSITEEIIRNSGTGRPAGNTWKRTHQKNPGKKEKDSCEIGIMSPENMLYLHDLYLPAAVSLLHEKRANAPNHGRELPV